MIKLQDFARQMGVTDRAIQKHLKNWENELQGHFERKGPNGTWLDDYAQDFIRERMKQQPVVVLDGEASDLLDKNRSLEQENRELQKKLIEAYEMLTAAKEQQLQLQQDLAEQKLLAAKAEGMELLLDETRERLKTAEDIAEMTAHEAEEEKQKFLSQIEEKEKETAALKEELEELQNRGFWARLFNKTKDKQGENTKWRNT